MSVSQTADPSCGGMGLNFDVEKYSKDKKVIADTIGMNVLNKLQSAFKWSGLPETIPQKWLETQLMINGFSFVAKAPDGNLYAFFGGLGGEPDPYYQPTIITVANPALNLSEEWEIGKDGVLVSNDTLRTGLRPIIGKYAGLLAENTVTIRIADIMSRLTAIMSAGDESTIESAKEYLKQLEAGNLGIIEESDFLRKNDVDDLRVQPAASSGNTRLTDLIEMEQYLKASLYNELGLQANYNMKREAVNSSEAEMGDDVLQPLIDNMLKERQEGAEAINKLFGTNISVEFDSAWKDNEEQREAELDNLEQEGDDNGDSEQSDDGNSGADSDQSDEGTAADDSPVAHEDNDGRSDDD